LRRHLSIGLWQQRILDGEARRSGHFKFLHSPAHVQRVAVAVIGIDQHRQRRGARHPPHLLGQFTQRDQRDIWIAKDCQRRH